MTERKVERILATGASYVTSGDLGCLLNIGGLISRFGYPVKAIHLAEILAGGTGGLSSFAADAASEDARPPGTIRRAGGR
jgi:L-lactate dehydrogenase complex protein LldE